MAGSPEEVGQVLETALELIQEGQESIDSMLFLFPNYAEALRPPLEAAEWLQNRSIVFDPQPEFVTTSRQRLLGQIQRERYPVISKKRSKTGKPKGKHFRRKVAFEAAAIITVLVLLVLSYWSAAKALESAIPGDSFYPIKVALERIRLAISLTDLGDSQLHAEFTNRRLVEMHKLVLEGRYELIPAAGAIFKNQLAQTLDLFESVADRHKARVQQLSENLGESLAKESSILAVLFKTSPEKTKGDLQQVLEITSSGVTRLQNLGEP
jgi:hypothetical protein